MKKYVIGLIVIISCVSLFAGKVDFEFTSKGNSIATGNPEWDSRGNTCSVIDVKSSDGTRITDLRCYPKQVKVTKIKNFYRIRTSGKIDSLWVNTNSGFSGYFRFEKLSSIPKDYLLSISLDQEFVTLIVRTFPDSVDVTVDGSTLDLQRSSYTIDLPSGMHYIVAQKKGYVSYSNDSLLVDSDNLKLDITLTPRHGLLLINTKPADALIKVDNNLISNNHEAVEMQAGTYNVKVFATGYVEELFDVEILPDKTTEKFVELEKKKPKFTVQTDPADCTLSFKNRQGETVLTEQSSSVIESLNPGNYILTVSNKGYESHETDIKVMYSISKPFEVTLSPLETVLAIKWPKNDYLPVKAKIYRDDYLQVECNSRKDLTLSGPGIYDMEFYVKNGSRPLYNWWNYKESAYLEPGVTEIDIKSKWLKTNRVFKHRIGKNGNLNYIVSFNAGYSSIAPYLTLTAIEGVAVKRFGFHSYMSGSLGQISLFYQNRNSLMYHLNLASVGFGLCYLPQSISCLTTLELKVQAAILGSHFDNSFEWSFKDGDYVLLKEEEESLSKKSYSTDVITYTPIELQMRFDVPFNKRGVYFETSVTPAYITDNYKWFKENDFYSDGDIFTEESEVDKSNIIVFWKAGIGYRF